MGNKKRQWLVRFGDVALVCLSESTARRVRRVVRKAEAEGFFDPDVLLRLARIARESPGVSAGALVSVVCR